MKSWRKSSCASQKVIATMEAVRRIPGTSSAISPGEDGEDGEDIVRIVSMVSRALVPGSTVSSESLWRLLTV